MMPTMPTGAYARRRAAIPGAYPPGAYPPPPPYYYGPYPYPYYPYYGPARVVSASALGRAVARPLAPLGRSDCFCGAAGLYGPAVFIWAAMPPKNNPAKLNPLQLRTLTLLQAIARIPGAANPTAEWRYRHHPISPCPWRSFPSGRCDGCRGRDATGLENQAVWNALTRKGMIRSEWPHQIALTPEGRDYETGLAG